MRLLPFGELFAVMMIVFLLIALSSGYAPEERYERKVSAPEMLVVETHDAGGPVNIDLLQGVRLDDVLHGVNSVGFRSEFGNGNSTFFLERAYEFYHQIDASIQSNAFYIKNIAHRLPQQRAALARFSFKPTQSVLCPLGWEKDGLCHSQVYTFTDIGIKAVENCAGVLNDDAFVALGNKCSAISRTPLNGLRLLAPDDEGSLSGVSFVGFNDVSRRAIAVDLSEFRKNNASNIFQGFYCRFSDSLNAEAMSRVGVRPFSVQYPTLALYIKYDPSAVNIQATDITDFRPWIQSVINDSTKLEGSNVRVRMLSGAPFKEKVYEPEHDDIEGTIFHSKKSCETAFRNIKNGESAFHAIQGDVALKTFSVQVTPRLKAMAGLREVRP